MPWSSTAPNLEFSTGEPWLPLGESHRALAVDLQQSERGSVLEFARQCLKLRRDHAALHVGSMCIVEAGEQKLAFDRASNGRTLRCTFNLSDLPCDFQRSGTALIGVGDIDGAALGPYAAIIEEIA
jgi:alpha-glucosidase